MILLYLSDLKNLLPAIVQYRRVKTDKLTESPKSKETKMEFLATFRTIPLNRRKDLKIMSKSLSKNEYPFLDKPFYCAIDAEFVSFEKEVSEIHSDGTRSILRPSRLSLARVSVLRGCGNEESVPFIDDYIATTDPIVDYLTEFSGINGNNK